MLGKTLRVLLLLAACLHMGASHADLWGYVDGKGVAHFASKQLDARYELFFRGDIVGVGKQPQDNHKAVAVPTAPRRLLAFFEVSIHYKTVRPIMRQMSDRHKIEYELLKAVIATESGFDPKALSPRGAVGLMQLMPMTAQRFGLPADPSETVTQRLADPRTNIGIGADYLSHLLKRFQGDVSLALAAYNSGEGTVVRAGNRIPDIAETQQYVRTVMQLYRVLKPPVSARPPSGPALRLNTPTTAPAETYWY
jgi:soluble lytic murein transglycosylase-like protein